MQEQRGAAEAEPAQALPSQHGRGAGDTSKLTEGKRETKQESSIFGW